jgi:hypothetical protein
MTCNSSNINPLYNNSFKFIINRGTDQLELMVQRVNLPSITIGDQAQPTIFGTTIPVPTLAIGFDTLNVEFVVDSNLENWQSLYTWMRFMTNIADDTSYNDMDYQYWHNYAILSIYGNPQDINFSSSSSCGSTGITVKFHNVIPISLSGLNFQSDSTDLTIQKSTCKFKYSYYEFLPDPSGYINLTKYS